MTTESSVLRHYELGASLIVSMDPKGSFLLELLPTTSTHLSALSPTLIPQLHYNQTEITVVEFKDLRQTTAIEIVYGKMNA
jgi:hypothetical protein